MGTLFQLTGLGVAEHRGAAAERRAAAEVAAAAAAAHAAPPHGRRDLDLLAGADCRGEANTVTEQAGVGPKTPGSSAAELRMPCPVCPHSHRWHKSGHLPFPGLSNEILFLHRVAVRKRSYNVYEHERLSPSPSLAFQTRAHYGAWASLDRQIPGNIGHTAVPSLQGYFVLGYSSVYVHSCVYVVYTYAHARVYSFLRVEVRGQYPESSPQLISTLQSGP